MIAFHLAQYLYNYLLKDLILALYSMLQVNLKKEWDLDAHSRLAKKWDLDLSA